MEIGIVSSAYFGAENYEMGLKKLKSHGYSCYDYQNLIDANSPFYTMDEAEFLTYFKTLAEKSKEAGVRCSQVHAVWPDDYSTEEKRNLSLETKYKRGVLACKALGCKYLVVHPIMPDGMRAQKEEEFPEIRKINLEFWKKLLPFAKENGVILCFENMPFTTHGLASVPSIVDFVREVSNPNFKICLDTGHANVFHENIYEDLLLIGDDLAVLHVHDNNSRGDFHYLPFFGNINWEDFRRGLKAIGFNKVLSLETVIPEGVPEPQKEEMERTLFRIAEYLAK